MGMNKGIMLVDANELRTLIEGLDLKDQKRNEYIKARWLNYVLWWDSRASKNKWKYHSLRCGVVIGGALIPALVGLREMQTFARYGGLFAIASIVVSIVIAMSAGLEEIFRFGDIWREKRAAAEVIKIEGFRYFQLTGSYRGKSHEEAYPDFAARVEEIIEHEIKDYIVAVKPRDEVKPPENQPNQNNKK
jgi:Protein of unknown function (DUF4231)